MAKLYGDAPITVAKHASLKHGCCADKVCTPETCMTLPDGASCSMCVTATYCRKVFGVDPANTWCDFYPRRYRPQVLLAEALKPAVRFEADVDMVGELAHVRLHRWIVDAGHTGFAKLGGQRRGPAFGVYVMQKHEAEAFAKMVKADFDRKDTTVRACSWCGSNICSAEGVTGDKCPPCEEDFKAGKAKPKGFDE